MSIEAFTTPKSLICSVSSTLISSDKKYPWTGADVYKAYFSKHETKANVHVCRVCNHERSCDIKRSYGNLCQKHVMTDYASSFEEEMVVYMQSNEKSKMVETHFKPSLNKRAEDIYSWVNVIVKKDWSFDTVNDEDVRGIIKLSCVREKALKTYMHGIGKKMKIFFLVNDSVLFLMDGMMDAIFAVAPDKSNVGKSYLLANQPLLSNGEFRTMVIVMLTVWSDNGK